MPKNTNVFFDIFGLNKIMKKPKGIKIMNKKEIKYHDVNLKINYHPTKERSYTLTKNTSVEAPQFVECTYDVGLELLKDRKLGSGCFVVYMALLSYRNTTTNDCHPSVERIHEDFGISVKSIKRAIDLLYQKGYIDINSGTKNVANNYYFPKEYWYPAWDVDFYQSHAKRRTNTFKEKRKSEKEQLLEENKELKKIIKEAGLDKKDEW